MCSHFRTHWYSPRFFSSPRRKGQERRDGTVEHLLCKQVCIQHFHIAYRSAIIRPTHFSDNRLGDAKTVSNLAESLNQ